ncbi:MAG: ZIP family metal transporter, partial [Fusobacteriaceae bacterium]
FIEILPEAREGLVQKLGEMSGNAITIISFFFGMLLVGTIDKVLPNLEKENLKKDDDDEFKCLYRMGVLSAITIGIHNFPEGIAVFFSGVKDMRLGLTMMVAIGLHNIAVGLAIGIPIYYATGSRKKAILFSSITALCAPVGAIIGYFVMLPFLNETIFGIIFGVVAGMLVFISLDEILPAAEEYGEHHTVIYGVISGMFVMAVSLVLMHH